MNQAFRDLMEQAKEQRQQSPLNMPTDSLEKIGANADAKSAKLDASLVDSAVKVLDVPRKIQMGKIIVDYWEKSAASSETLAPDLPAKKGRKNLSRDEKQKITKLIVSVPEWVALAIEKIECPGQKGKKLKKLITQYQGYQEREKKQLAPLKKILDAVIYEKEEYAKKYLSKELYQSRNYRMIDKLISHAQVAINLGSLLCIDEETLKQVLGKKYLDEYLFCHYLINNMSQVATGQQLNIE